MNKRDREIRKQVLKNAQKPDSTIHRLLDSFSDEQYNLFHDFIYDYAAYNYELSKVIADYDVKRCLGGDSND